MHSPISENPPFTKIAPWWRAREITSVLVLLSSVLTAALVFRFWQIESLPGVSGDEAFIAVLVRDALAGNPVAYWAPTGRVFSPLYSLLILLTDAWLPPSFWALRLPAMLAGLFVIPLTFVLFRKAVGLSVAAVLTVLVAVSPVNIVYSRLAIEQTLMIYAGAALLSAAWRGPGWRLWVAAVLALLIHPINVFLAPIPALLCIAHYWPLTRLTAKTRLALVGALLALALGIYFEIRILPARYAVFLDPHIYLSRLWATDDMLYFARAVVRLVTGVTALEQFASPPSSRLNFVADTLGGFALVSLLGFGLRKLWRERDRRAVALIVGVLVMVAGYYLVTGRDAIEPGVTRYALVLLFPLHLALALCLTALTRRWSQSTKLLTVASYGAVTLAWFYVGFFYSIQNQNSTAFRAYYTGLRDPKRVSADFIRWDVARSKGAAAPVTVVAEDWWIYWPLRYLFSAERHISVWMYQEGEGAAINLREAMDKGAYAVGFTREGPFAQQVPRLFSRAELQQFRTPGYGGHPVLSVWRVQR